MAVWRKSKPARFNVVAVAKRTARRERQMSKLQDRLDEFKKTFESGVPPYNAQHAAIEMMHRATTELKASGIEDHALKVGDRAPSFTLFNQDHVRVASTDLRQFVEKNKRLFDGCVAKRRRC